MCNKIHNEYRSIPSEGIGYKLFFTLPSGEYVPLVKGLNYYNKDTDGWVHWINTLNEDGFCFIPDKTQAKNAKEVWSFYHTVLRKIEYKQGLVEQEETGFLSLPITIGLCKQFRIIED